MMTVETLIIKLGVNPKEISKAELILLTSLVERYNHGYMRRSKIGRASCRERV